MPFYGNENNNVIYGTSGDEYIFGFGGNDTLHGGYGNDTLLGGEGNDVVFGGWGNDIFYTDRGFDRYHGDVGNDIFYAFNYSGFDLNYIYGGFGWDIVDFSYAVNSISSNVNNHFLYQVEEIHLSSHNDVVWNTVFGDHIREIYGQGGDDYISQGNDWGILLDGGTGNDTIYAGTQNDTVIGGAGDDRLGGNAGHDLITGGSGADMFVFTQEDDHSGTNGEIWASVADFDASQGDTIQIRETTSHSSWGTLEYIGGSSFDGDGTGQVRVVRDFFNNPLVANVYIDTDGNGSTDGRIVLTLASWFGGPDASDFIL